MTIEQIRNIAEETLIIKMNKNPNFIRYTYYEIWVDKGVPKSQIDLFLEYARDELESYDYDVYFTNAKYEFEGKVNIVKSNELLIAIK